MHDAWQPSIGAGREQIAFDDPQALGRIPLQQAIQQRRAVIARFNRHVANVKQSRQQLI
jgi:hypothetical protein